MKRFEFKIHGPIKGGKNAVQITRSGHRYPNPKWAAWRDQIVNGIQELWLKSGYAIFDKPCFIHIIYIPADLKRRDTPAMLDSIYHCLERAEIVKDDCLIQRVHWEPLPKDKDKAGASIILEEI